MGSRPRHYRKCYIVTHGRGFKYLRAVPKDLQAIEHKQAWVKCLGVINRREAETLAHALAYEHERRIEALRADLACNGVSHLASTDYDATASVTQRLVQGPDDLPLMRLVDLWVRVRAPRSPTSIKSMRRCVRRFVTLIGDLDARAITRSHVAAYRDTLENRVQLSPSNVAGHLNKLHVLFNTAISEDLLASNPTQSVRARNPSSKLAGKRQPFTPEQVHRIFEKLKGERSDFGWTVRLLAYHGMRSGEVCQLRCDDITTLHGTAVIRVHDLHGPLKNRASIRDIPIHPSCIGIIGAAKETATKHGPECWLFPAIPRRKRRPADWFHHYASLFLREKVGIKDRRYTMHSFRHLWRTLARDCEMPESVSRAIMGHTLGAGEHGAYGNAPSLRLRAEWIAKIDPLGG
jgi:integrase